MIAREFFMWTLGGAVCQAVSSRRGQRDVIKTLFGVSELGMRVRSSMVRKALSVFNLRGSAPREGGRIPYTLHTIAILFLSVASGVIKPRWWSPVRMLVQFGLARFDSLYKPCS